MTDEAQTTTNNQEPTGVIDVSKSDTGTEGKETKKPERGRPTKYCQEILDNTRKFIDNCEDEIYQLIKTDGDKSTTYENRLKVNIPTIEGLCLELKISEETLYQWEKQFKEFSELVKELRKKQAKMLLQKGLSGDYNPMIAKLILTKHGYIEKQEVDQNVDVNGILVLPQREKDKGKENTVAADPETNGSVDKK